MSSAKQQATTVRAALTAGDYAVRSKAGTPVAVVERKSLADLAGALNNGTLVFELANLTEMLRAAVVVEDRYGSPVEARVYAGRLPAGHSGSRPDPLPGDSDRLPRDATARRGVDVPVSRGGAGRVRIRTTPRAKIARRRTADGLRRGPSCAAQKATEARRVTGVTSGRKPDAPGAGRRSAGTSKGGFRYAVYRSHVLIRVTADRAYRSPDP